MRTAGRMLFTHRRLLEWSPSNNLDGNGRLNLFASYLSMWIAPVLAVATGIYLSLSRPAGLVVAGPILGLWFVSPVIAWWISRPLARRAARLSIDQTLFLRKLSPENLGILRDLRRAGGSLAAA